MEALNNDLNNQINILRTIEPAEAEVFIDRTKELISDLDSKALKPDEREELCARFLESVADEGYSLSSYLKNFNTSPYALEALRRIFLLNQDNNSFTNQRFKGLLCSALTDSLESLDHQLDSEEFIEDERGVNPFNRKRFANNALYAASETLNFSDKLSREKISLWLMDHKKELERSIGEETADCLPEDIFYNLIFKAESKELSREALEILWKKDRQYMIVASLADKDLLMGPRPGYLSGRINEVARFFADKLGFGEKIVEKWNNSKIFLHKDEKGKNIFRPSYQENIEAAIYLETKIPGSAKRLYKEYGIANFARYKPAMLLRQLETAENGEKYGVAAYSEFDWNGSSFKEGKKLEQPANKLAEHEYRMIVIEAGSARDFARRLRGFKNKYGLKASFIIASAHGNPGLLIFGKPAPQPVSENNVSVKKNFDGNSIKAEDLSNGIYQKVLSECLEPGAPVIAISCHAGELEGIAQAASKLGIMTIGPNGLANLNSMDVKFGDDGKPDFEVKYSGRGGAKVETTRYEAGILKMIDKDEEV